MNNQKKSNLNLADTFRKLFQYNVFGCSGPEMHVSFGNALFKSRKGYTCPRCGAAVNDISDSPVGRSYFEIGRPDLSQPAT